MSSAEYQPGKNGDKKSGNNRHSRPSKGWLFEAVRKYPIDDVDEFRNTIFDQVRFEFRTVLAGQEYEFRTVLHRNQPLKSGTNINLARACDVARAKGIDSVAVELPGGKSRIILARKDGEAAPALVNWGRPLGVRMGAI
jgi:hypothetical protein